MTPARCRNVKEVGQRFASKLATEAPVNGGRNYDGPKVNFVSLSKTWPNAGNSGVSDSTRERSLVKICSVRTISRKGRRAFVSPESPETTRQGLETISSQDIVRAAWRHAGIR